MAETIKARERRMREGVFDKYLTGLGIDIGCGNDPVTEGCVMWDKQDGDATCMATVADGVFDWVHSSHCLEHIDFPQVAIKNWFRILKPGGYLVLLLPDRQTYEKRVTLPSRWNGDHRHFWLPDRNEPPCTIGLIPLITQTLTGYRFIYCKVCDDGHTVTDPERHSDGEYSIEAVIRKL